MKLQRICTAFLLWSLAVFSVQAKWMTPQIERVPIDRLFLNLQHRLATNVHSVEPLYQLARLHSMAYATNVPVVPVNKRTDLPLFYDPWQDPGVPRKVVPRATAQAQAEALQHLTNAVRYYERAAELAPTGTNFIADRWLLVPIHLGLAWTLDQAGRTNDAIQTYRDALQLAWRQEVDADFTYREHAGLSWDKLRSGNEIPKRRSPRTYRGPGACYSEEIIRYLLPLLDSMKDAKEIAQLEVDCKSLESMGRAITPLIVSLKDGTSLDELVDASARVAFDLDGSGKPRHWGWITTNAAWLVFDRDGSGRITSGLQMFGSVTFWIFWRDGYHALSSLDDNGDGKLSGNELRGLALWNDHNGDGISDAGEVTPVSKLGIETIDCNSELHSSGIPFNERGVIFRDGSSHATYDWIAPSR